MRVLVVLPTYNEAENIVRVLERVREALPDATMLVVDDNSPDETADLAEKAGVTVGGVEILRRPEKSGLGSAYRDGFAWGLARGFEALIEMDSDLSHDPDDLPRLVRALEAGNELVIGSCYVPGGAIPDWSWHRRLLSRGGNLYVDRLLGLGVKDSTAGMRAYAAALLRRIDLVAVQANSYGFQIEMTYLATLAGASVVEVPIRFVDRTEGTSKMSLYTVVEALGLVSLWGARRVIRPRRSASPMSAGGRPSVRA